MSAQYKRKTQRGRARKHITQMTRDEVEYLRELISKVDNITLCDHAQEAAARLNVSEQYIKAVNLQRAQLVEFNTGRGASRRVVLRDKRAIHINRYQLKNLVLVIDVDTKEVVTIFLNDIHDHHNSIDFTYYTKDLKIIK